MNDQVESPGGGAQRKGDRIFFATLALAWLFALVHAALQFTHVETADTGPYLVGLDQNCYFAYAHSLLFDGDLDFRNQYEFLAKSQPPSTAEVFQQLLAANSARPVNQFNIGTGLAALPALGVVRVLLAGAAGAGVIHPVSPFASVYPLVFCLMNVTFGFGALACCYLFLRRWFSASACAVGCWGVLLCGPMLYYIWAEAAMSHLTGAFFTSAALLCWSRWTESNYVPRKAAFAFLAGFCAAFAAVVRPYDAPVSIVLVQPILAAVLQRRSIRSAAILTSVAALGAIVGAAPQLIAWKLQFGNWVVNTTDHPFPWNSPWAAHVLFSRRHGLFFWSPGLLIAIVVLAISTRRTALPAAWLLAIFAAVTWMAGTWWFYWIGVSFGMRTYVDHPVPFAFGFAASAAWLIRKMGNPGRNVAWECVALFALINIHLVLCFRGGVIWVDGPLYWNHTIASGKKYKNELRRELSDWTDFTPGRRASLFSAPTGF